MNFSLGDMSALLHIACVTWNVLRWIVQYVRLNSNRFFKN